MKFKLLRSKRVVDRDISKHFINWDKKVTRGGKKNFGKLQFDVKQLLRPYWEEHVVAEEFPIPAIYGDRGKSLDIVNFTTRQVVEVQGRCHTEMVEGFFHKNKYQYFRQLQRDEFKFDWAELNGFRLYEVYQDDELNEELLRRLEII